ncbi:cystatin-like protein [Puntigrus tetrazona]|uniref:cystatin-like protein n=1 Tax=Puntigrus tetrazona TaxID=1606681 RepID=UPI001C8A796F|nr:cystatin-like protein [Puntigrus tetrazona]
MRGMLFLFSVLFLLELTKGQKYEDLNERERGIVDEAIKKANDVYGKDKHLDFYTIIQRTKSVMNVILRPTSCAKKTPSVHREECKIHNKAPQVSCIHCNGSMKPCLLLRQKEEIKIRLNECQNPPLVNGHIPGASHVLYQKREKNQQEIGCSGCV